MIWTKEKRKREDEMSQLKLGRILQEAKWKKTRTCNKIQTSTWSSLCVRARQWPSPVLISMIISPSSASTIQGVYCRGSVVPLPTPLPLPNEYTCAHTEGRRFESPNDTQPFPSSPPFPRFPFFISLLSPSSLPFSSLSPSSLPPSPSPSPLPPSLSSPSPNNVVRSSKNGPIFLPCLVL